MRDTAPVYILICTNCCTAPVFNMVVPILAERQADRLQPLDWLFHYTPWAFFAGFLAQRIDFFFLSVKIHILLHF